MKIPTRIKRTHLGHKIGKETFIQGAHPSMLSFLAGTRGNTSIFNGLKTNQFLAKALYIIALMVKDKGYLLIVNTNPEFTKFVKNIIEEKSEKKKVVYSHIKWVGGTLTNWIQVQKSIKTYASFSKKFDFFLTENFIEFPKYAKMKKSFQGFINKKQQLHKQVKKKRPTVIFIINPNENRYVIKEANKLNIPIVALADSNTNLNGISYPIPINNCSIEYIYFIFSWIIRIINKG